MTPSIANATLALSFFGTVHRLSATPRLTYDSFSRPMLLAVTPCPKPFLPVPAVSGRKERDL